MVSVPDHTMDEVPLQDVEGGSLEFRLLMSYAQRTLPKSKYSDLQRALSVHRGHTAAGNGKEEPENRGGGKSETRSKKKRRSWTRRLTPACLRPPKGKEEEPGRRKVKNPEEEAAEIIASNALRTVRRMRAREEESGFRMIRVCSIQQDGDDEDDTIAQLVSILRSAGDRMNEQMMEERTLENVKDLWSYNFYKKVADCFLSEAVPQEEQQSSRMALCLHVTTALTMVDSQLMSKGIGFGARYLRENFSPWILSPGGQEMKTQNKEEEEEVD